LNTAFATEGAYINIQKQSRWQTYWNHVFLNRKWVCLWYNQETWWL
jgi:hypothetical protein